MATNPTIPRGATSFYDFSDGQMPPVPPTDEKPEDDKPTDGSAPPPPPTATPTLTGGSGGSTTTTAGNNNDNGQFNGSTYGELEDFLKDRLNYYKSLEESDEERQKREKRERRQKSLATIGDILGAFHRGYAYQRGIQPMDIPSLSDKMQARFDKAKAEREKNGDRILNYVTALDKLNDNKAQADYRQKMLNIRQQQQDRLTQHEETQRTIADARVKYYEAQSNKNDEQAAYWKTKADLLERGFPLQQAEQLARIEERKAHTAKLNHDANAPYKTSSSGKGSGSSSSGQQNGSTSRQRSGGSQSSQPSSNGGSYTNTKKLGL